METLKVSINKKIRDFSIDFATFNFLTKIGEKSTHLFPESKKKRIFILPFERKERNKNN